MRRALPFLYFLASVTSACGGGGTKAPSPAPAATAAADLATAAVAASGAPTTPVPPQRAGFVPSDIPRIDVHTHIELGALAKAVALLGAHGIVHLVNLSGGSPGGDGLEETLAEAQRVGHTTVFVNPDFREIKRGPGYGARMAAKIKQATTLGARGVKITKGLGLGYTDANGRLVAVDDAGLDPVFEMAGKLGMPIAIHTRRPEGVLEAGDAGQRALRRAERASRLELLRRAGDVGGALRAVRATRGAPSEDDVHRRALRQRPRGPGARGARC